jgi:ectoine hydroxylase
MISILRASEEPVPIVGPAGTAALFHCNTLHASGHNLTAEDRWHIYISFNSCANAPQFGPKTRPDWVVSRNTRALPVEDDDALLKASASRITA